MANDLRVLLKTHPVWLFWHPHQKLWNWAILRLVDRVFGQGVVTRGVVRAIVWFDTLLLSWRVGRVRGGGTAKSILYIDVGLHRDARQLRHMLDWFGGEARLSFLGVEANPEHLKAAQVALGAHPRLELVNFALVGPSHTGDTIALYLDQQSGLEDSILAGRAGATAIQVPSARLSDLLDERSPDAVILRMNCEGAEREIIHDLIERGAFQRSSFLFLGMWDDYGKTYPKEDEDFRRDLRAHGISSVTFNDRDETSAWRLRVIRRHIAAFIGG